MTKKKKNVTKLKKKCDQTKKKKDCDQTKKKCDKTKKKNGCQSVEVIKKIVTKLENSNCEEEKN